MTQDECLAAELLVADIERLAPDVAKRRRELDVAVAKLRYMEEILRVKIIEIVEPIIGVDARMPINDLNNYIAAMFEALCRKAPSDARVPAALKKVAAIRELLFNPK